MTRRAPPSAPSAPLPDDLSNTPSSDPPPLLTPITSPEMKETMLTYGQKMELELLAKVTKQARETVTKEVREEVTKELKEEVTQQVTRDLLLRQLTRRFGSLPADVVARVQQAGRHELEDWADRILDATSLDDVFSAPLG